MSYKQHLLSLPLDIFNTEQLYSRFQSTGLLHDSYSFWSFLRGFKLLRGFWEVLCCLWWIRACGKNVWEPEDYVSIAMFLFDRRWLDSVVQSSQKGLCPSFLDFSQTCPDSGFAHAWFIPACTVRQLQLRYCCAVMDWYIISEHRHNPSNSDSIQTRMWTIVSWIVVKRWWKESTGIVWKLNSLSLKFSREIPICSSEGSSAHS